MPRRVHARAGRRAAQTETEPGGVTAPRDTDDASVPGRRSEELPTERPMRRRFLSPTCATVPEAIRFLASCCDGARTRDGYGFNRDHVEIGHALAQLPDQHWD